MKLPAMVDISERLSLDINPNSIEDTIRQLAQLEVSFFELLCLSVMYVNNDQDVNKFIIAQHDVAPVSLSVGSAIRKNLHYAGELVGWLEVQTRQSGFTIVAKVNKKYDQPDFKKHANRLFELKKLLEDKRKK
jgi:hypothetical protein